MSEYPIDTEVCEGGLIMLMIGGADADELEAFCEVIRADTGARVDWHNAQGHQVVKALGDFGAVEKAILDRWDQLRFRCYHTEFMEGGKCHWTRFNN